MWDAKRNGEKNGATTGGAGKGEGEKGQELVGLIVQESCESHTEGKAASHLWESITVREANPSYEACASIIKTAGGDNDLEIFM